MSDTKISALTALTGANVDETADVLPIVDTSVTTTKKILVSELFTLTGASPQITLGKLNTTSGGIKFFGSTSGNVTLAPNVAAGASVTVTLPATSVTLNAAGDLTGTTLVASVVTSSLTTVGALNSGSITSGFGSIDVGADAISGGAISGTTGTFTGNVTLGNAIGDVHVTNGTMQFLANAASDSVQISDATALAAGVGGQLSFTGIYTGTTQVFGAAIKAKKTNATDGNYSFGLSLQTRENGQNVTERLLISDVGIHTMSAYGAGTATFSSAGVISSVSDERLKIKDGSIKDPIPMLMALEPGYFFGKPEANMGDARQLGFYAQNVRKAIGPEAAPDPLDGRPWGYFDRSVLAVVVDAAKNQESRLRTLEARLK